MSDSSSRIVGVPADLLERLRQYADEVYDNWSHDGQARSETVFEDAQTVSALLASVPSSEGEETPDDDVPIVRSKNPPKVYVATEWKEVSRG